MPIDEREQKVEEILPDSVVLLINHSSLNFDSDIADLAHVVLVRCVDTVERLEHRLLHLVASWIAQALPQVRVVALVADIGSVHCRRGDVSAENDSSERLGLDRNLGLIRVEDSCHNASVLVCIVALGSVEVVLSLLALRVVVRQDLLKNAAKVAEGVGGQFNHCVYICGGTECLFFCLDFFKDD